MENHIKNICRKSSFQLYRINQLRVYIDQKTTESLMHSFITSNLDYCNSLLYNTPLSTINKLQRLQNWAARIVTKTPKYSHITPTLKELHWLPVK